MFVFVLNNKSTQQKSKQQREWDFTTKQKPNSPTEVEMCRFPDPNLYEEKSNKKPSKSTKKKWKEQRKNQIGKEKRKKSG